MKKSRYIFNRNFERTNYQKGSGTTVALPTVTGVTISGNAIVNQILTVSYTLGGGTADTITRRWYRGATLIFTSTTVDTYVPVQADAGQNIKCTVTATNSAGSASADSNVVAILATLLDLYPNAAAAYSVRLLRGAYLGSPAIRVRRSNDNAEQDIGFTTTGDLNTSALTTFVGANSGYIVTWYDQSGNANHATQTTPASQPRIVNAGVLDVVNSKAAPLFDGTNDSFNLTSTINYGASHLGAFVGKRDAAGRRILGLATTSINGYILTHWVDNKFILQGDSAGFQTSNATDTTTSQELVTGERVSGSMIIYKNNTLQASTFSATTLGTTINSIGKYAGFIFSFGYCQETIFYNTAQNTNRSGINTNIINYYGIV